MQRTEAIVLGGDHHNTLNLIRSLGRKGIYPDVLLCTNEKRPYVARSRYIRRLTITRTPAESLKWLEEAGYDGTPVLFTCSDMDAFLVDSNKERLSHLYHIPNVDGESGLDRLMDKDVMAEIAVSSGLRVPLAYLSGDIDIKYPLIAKPLRSIDGSKSDISVLHGPEEMTAYRVRHKDSNVQYQQFIDSLFEYQLIGCSLDGGRIVCIPGYSKIIRKPQNTNTGFLSYHKTDGTFPIDECRSFIRRVGYSGLFSMEFLRGKEGKDYFMEINFRNDGNSICVTQAGVNLPYIWYAYNSSLDDYVDELSKDIHDVLVMPEFDDFVSSVVHGKLSLWRWILDLRKCDCLMEYAPDDKAPFYAMLRRFIHRGINKMLHRI